MHNINLIRNNPVEFDLALKRRGIESRAQKILEIDNKKREVITKLQELQAQRNHKSDLMASIKDKQSTEFQASREAVQKINNDITGLKESEAKLSQELDTILSELPNILANDVPEGADETQNQVVFTYGKPTELGFTPKTHFELGEALGFMDFETGAKISGSRFVILKSQLAKLERALANFMLDIHTTEFGFQEISPPLLVKSQSMYGTTQLPKFHEDSFETKDGMWLIPTSEVPLTNIVADQIVDAESLPMRFTAYTPCFRSEAGSAGKDTRGMIRLHQFSKVELVTIATEEQSAAEYGHLLKSAETILQRLELPYRKILLCSGDTGFGSEKTYDLEVWLPSQNCYREISSCSIFGQFQARRMKARYRSKGDKETKFLYTMNGSGLAVGRTIVAILENYQTSTGDITVPNALHKYMGKTIISKED